MILVHSRPYISVRESSRQSLYALNSHPIFESQAEPNRYTFTSTQTSLSKRSRTNRYASTIKIIFESQAGNSRALSIQISLLEVEPDQTCKLPQAKSFSR